MCIYIYNIHTYNRATSRADSLAAELGAHLTH